MSKDTIWKWLHGRRTPGVVHLDMIRELLRAEGATSATKRTGEGPVRPHGLVALPGGKLPPPAQEPVGMLPPFLRPTKSAAKPLTGRETDELRSPIVAALKVFWTYADETISITNKQHAPARIWQTIDDGETTVIADFVLAQGLKSAVAAQIARGIADSYKKFQVGIILAPRMAQSVRHYMAHGGLSL